MHITTGHCYCGAIAFEIKGQPIKVAHCHCESCRRALGAVMVTSAGFRLDQVIFVSEQPKNFVSEKSTRGFCSHCGSSISYRKNGSEFVFIYLGLFNEPEKFVPEVHMMYSEKVEWLDADNHLPRADDFA